MQYCCSWVDSIYSTAAVLQYLLNKSHVIQDNISCNWQQIQLLSSRKTWISIAHSSRRCYIFVLFCALSVNSWFRPVTGSVGGVGASDLRFIPLIAFLKESALKSASWHLEWPLIFFQACFQKPLRNCQCLLLTPFQTYDCWLWRLSPVILPTTSANICN